MPFTEKYYEGQVGASNPADDLRVAIATNVINVTGWSIVDDAYSASSKIRSVLKLASGTSGLATDLYITLINSTTAGGTKLWAYVSEAYDTGTHLATYPAYPNASTDSSCRFTSGYPTTIGNYMSDSGGQAQGDTTNYTVRGAANIITTGPNGFWAMNVYADHILITTNTGTIPLYIGKFTTMVITPETNDPNPICMWQAATPAVANCNYYGGYNIRANSAIFTRWAMNPSYTHNTSYAHDWMCSAYAQTPYSVQSSTLSLGYFSSTTDPYSGSVGVPFVPIVLLNAAHINLATTGTSKGLFRGKLKDIAYTGGNGTWGDTMTIAGETWQCTGSGYFFRKTP